MNNKVEIEIELLIDASIDIQQYLFCNFIYYPNLSLFNMYLEQFDKFFTKESLEDLIEKGFIKLLDTEEGFKLSNIKVTDKYIKTFIPNNKKVAENSKVEDWIDEWYTLFPRGIKSGGYLVRSDKNGCLVKMRKFLKQHPEFGKTIIMKATKEYVDKMQLNNY